MTVVDMALMSPFKTSKTSPLYRFSPSRQGLKRITATLGGTLAIVLGIWTNPAAADPFRTTEPHQIGDQTEAAFKAMFEEGNYVEATELLKTAETDEPLAYALKASLAYINEDLDAMGENARLTRETAESLIATDPLRGHLYTAAGYFLEGAYAFLAEGVVQSTPAVLSGLQKVFSSLDEAEKIDPNDPELNLLKGYMDLMLAVNLPFANPEEAIQRLQSYAAPTYLSQRGIAIGYRDLDQQDQALAAIDQAIQQAPSNPELFYLKAQILRRKSDDVEGEEQRRLRRQSLNFFRQAWALRTQLPQPTVEQLDREACRTFQQLRNRNADACHGDTAIDWQRDQPTANTSQPASPTASPTTSPTASPTTAPTSGSSPTPTATPGSTPTPTITPFPGP